MSSTYLLSIFLRVSRTIRIGRLGTFFFPSGHYIYVGSAKRSFHKRIDRHLRKRKKIHWHIDYLLQHARVTHVWSCDLAEERAAEIISATMKSPVPHFGSSDKRSGSHLFYGELKQSIPELTLVPVRQYTNT
jgi:sugar fermentation stimulation protein A